MRRNRNADERQLSCRLERRDGSAWQVIWLDLDSDPPSVTAVLCDPAVTCDRRSARLEKEPLARGDRLVWLNRRGEVVWALRSPL